ncbi:hypothetical protein [Actinacidiphila sp. bgisy160]|uniref:hypothetical protein n=1 Tax=Actinacidiphila sp. bgisy160 TaxID=3413796 RepID=UPI003D74A3CD
MPMESGAHSAVLDTLTLVHEQMKEQHEGCSTLRSQLAQAEGRLARLEALYTSLIESLPDLGVSPQQPREATEGETVEGQDAEAEDLTPSDDPQLAVTEVDNESGTATLPDLIMNLMASANRPLRVRDVLEAINRLRDQGRTDKLRSSKRPTENVRTALNRLARKGLVVKVSRGVYEIARADNISEAA